MKKLFILTSILCGASALTACDLNDNDNHSKGYVVNPQPTMGSDTNTKATYTVKVQNLTYAQPFSPITLVGHNQGKLWKVGEMASSALEKLAEGGDNSQLLALPVVDMGVSANAPLGAGKSATYTIELDKNASNMLSVATMLVNTNDAFSGLNGVKLDKLMVGDSMMHYAMAYDAGTEANSETAGSIPGPADGGTGYDQARDDVDFVAMHAGVVSQDDGLSTSVLMQQHRFDNPVMKVVVTRTK